MLAVDAARGEVATGLVTFAPLIAEVLEMTAELGTVSVLRKVNRAGDVIG